MELVSGIWWTNVLNSALPPQRHRSDILPEHQYPVSHTAQKKREKKEEERKNERKKERKKKGRKEGKEGKSTCLCNIPRTLESCYHQSSDNVKMAPWNSLVGD